MRTSNWFLVLCAGMIGFAAVALGFETSSWTVALSVLGVAVSVLLVALLRNFSTPRMLLVGDASTGPVIRLRETLDDSGYNVVTCVGPAGRPCPVLAGQPCPVKGCMHGAMIYTPEKYRSPEAPCSRALRIAAVTMDARAEHRVGEGRRDIHVPARVGPSNAVKTLLRLSR